MSAVDSRSVIVALPTISLHFGLSLDGVQWIPLAYQGLHGYSELR